MKRIMLLITVIITMLISCQKEVETLQFRITWKAYSGRGEAIEKIVASYESDDVGISMIGGDEELDAIRQDIQNKASHIFVLPYRYVKLLGEEGLLKPIDISRIVDYDQLFDGLTTFGKVNDTNYGIPWVSHSMALIYNQTKLSKAGISVNDIVDRTSFVDVLKRVEENSDMKGIGLVGAKHNDVSWMVNQCIYGFGGILENGGVAIRSPESKAALHFYKSLGDYAQAGWQDHDGTDVMDAFRKQDIAFEIQGLWGVTDIWKNGDLFEVGVLPLSTIGLSSEVGPMLLAIPNHLDKNKEEKALNFMNYMLSEKAQIMIMNGEYSPERDNYYPFRLSVRKDALYDKTLDAYKIFDVFYDAYENPSVDVPSAGWMIIKDLYYTDGLHRLMKDEITIDEFLEMIEQEGHKIIGGRNE